MSIPSRPRRERAAVRRLLTLEVLETRLPFDASVPLIDAGPASEAALLIEVVDLGDPNPVAPSIPENTSPPTSLAELRAYLLREAVGRHSAEFGEPLGTAWWSYSIASLDSVATVAASADAGPTTTTRETSSSTPTQIAGIDEGDLVENDGRYIYWLRGGEVVVLDAQSPADVQVVGRRSLGALQGWSSPVAMYLHNGRLTIVSTTWNGGDESRLMAYGSAVEVETFNVSRPDAITSVGRMVVDGHYRDSRMVGDRLTLVTAYYGGWKLPGLVIVPIGEGETIDPSSRATYRYETREEYVARMEEILAGDFLPGVWSPDAEGALSYHGAVVDPARTVYAPGVDLSRSSLFATVSTFDVSGAPALVDARSAAVGGVDAVSMSTDAVVIASHVDPEFVWNPGDAWMSRTPDDPNRTFLTRFGYDAAGALATPSQGEIAGRVNNQFWIDERGGVLRVVSTDVVDSWSGDSLDAGQGAHLHVLRPAGDRLEQVGAIDDLAPGERVFSARFFGDIAYVVTFPEEEVTLQALALPIDPLFVISLADPTSPEVLGELKVSGFSDHLLPLDDGHLLAIGREVDPETGEGLGVQASIFDVTDWTRPELVSRTLLGGPTDQVSGIDRGWSQFASVDHHSLAYFPEDRLLALPMTTGRVWNGSGKFSVVRVSDDYSFAMEGEIPFAGALDYRATRVGDALYYLANDRVVACLVDAPAAIVADLDLGPEVVPWDPIASIDLPVETPWQIDEPISTVGAPTIIGPPTTDTPSIVAAPLDPFAPVTATEIERDEPEFEFAPVDDATLAGLAPLLDLSESIADGDTAAGDEERFASDLFASPDEWFDEGRAV